MRLALSLPWLLFPLLSLADLVLTWHLVRSGACREVNPLAAWLIARGWVYVVLFKVADVILVILISHRLRRLSPEAAQALISFGCGVIGWCVGVGLWYWLR